MNNTGRHSYVLIVFKDIDFLLIKEESTLTTVIKPSSEIRVYTGTISTAFLVYKSYYSGNTIQKTNSTLDENLL